MRLDIKLFQLIFSNTDNMQNILWLRMAYLESLACDLAKHANVPMIKARLAILYAEQTKCLNIVSILPYYEFVRDDETREIKIINIAKLEDNPVEPVYGIF